MQLSQFVPASILREGEPAPWARWPRGAVLFADVSGFTPMSEALSTLGAEGAEILTDVLNRYFAAMIGLVHGAGGEVMKFGGDAILCSFPGDDALPRALATALRMQEKMPAFAAIRTPVRRFALKMKIGVAAGESLLAGLGDPAVRLDWAFAGPPVDATSDAEHHASAGDVVVALDPGRLPAGATAEAVAPGFCRLLGMAAAPVGAPPPPAAGDPRPWLIDEVAQLVGSGHARQVASLAEMAPVFVAFSGFSYTAGTLELARLDGFVRLLNETLHRHGGRLNRISMGDKGSTALVLFGAPRPLEGKERMAAQWILELRRLCAERFPELVLRIGAASGRGFSGIVGAAGRFDYTVMGDVVNFAARLMQGAADGQACVSEAFAQGAGAAFAFDALGERRFKGKSQPLPVFALAERRRGVELPPPDGPAFGRDTALAEMRRAMAQPDDRPRLALFTGEAGSGKTFLLRHLAEPERQAGRRVLAIAGDPARRHTPWAPWRDLAERLLFGDRGPEADALDERLAAVGAAVLADRELHAAFWELPGSGPAALAVDGAAAAFAHQFARLLALGLSDEPTLLAVDGLESFDTASLDLLGRVIRELAGRAVPVVGAARPGWEAAALGTGVEVVDVPLEPLDREAIATLARAKLGRDAAEPLVGFLASRAGGNPLLTATLIALLEREGMLDETFGTATLARGAAMRFSSGAGDEILAAALAGLPGGDRLHLQAAAVLGVAFDDALLRRTVGRPFRAASLATLARGGHLRRGPSGEWGFAHGMVRETVYRALPARERRRWHARAGAALERDGDPARHLDALATHWGLAGSREKAIRWNLSAGERLLRQSSFPEAAHFLAEAWCRLSRSRDERRWRAGLDYGRALLQAGRFDESLDVSRRLERSAARGGIAEVALEAAANRFDAMQRMGDYSYAAEAERRLAGASGAASERLRLLLGIARMRTGAPDDAADEFRRVIDAGEAADPAVSLSAVSFLAFVQKTRGRFDESLGTIARGVALAERFGLQASLLRLEMVRAGILADRGELEAAAIRYRDLLPQLERVGDPYLLAFGEVNLATCAWQLGSGEEADRHATEALRLFTALGSREGIAQALEIRGIVQAIAGEHDRAIPFYTEAMDLLVVAGSRERTTQLRFNLAESLLAAGRHIEARKAIERGEGEARDAGDEPLLAAFADLRSRLPAEG